METLKHELLSSDAAKTLCDELLKEKNAWVDGRSTAGSHAAALKSNMQLDKVSKIAEKNSRKMINLIRLDPLIKSFALPRKVHGVMFSKTTKGQGYGNHIDNPYMSSGRSDLSFTIFLSPPESYKGGELCIQTIQSSEDVKLPAGHIAIYPSSYLHCVKEVKSGIRLVCVGWIHSYVGRTEDREILFCLDAGAKGLLSEYGRSPKLDLIFQAYSNLTKRLGS